MKKLLLLSAILGSITVFPSLSNAATSTNSAAAQEIIMRSNQPGRRWRNRRTVIQTRVVWRFGRRYRETYRITYRPNGAVRTQVISRVLLPGRRVYRNY